MHAEYSRLARVRWWRAYSLDIESAKKSCSACAKASRHTRQCSFSRRIHGAVADGSSCLARAASVALRQVSARFFRRSFRCWKSGGSFQVEVFSDFWPVPLLADPPMAQRTSWDTQRTSEGRRGGKKSQVHDFAEGRESAAEFGDRGMAPSVTCSEPVASSTQMRKFPQLFRISIFPLVTCVVGCWT